MPEPLHPPYLPTAMTVPRMLNRWLDVNPQNGQLTRVATYIELPSFSVTKAWAGASEIVAAFDYEGPNNISLKGYTTPENANYALVVAYRVGTVIVRYSLWGDNGADFPHYNGEILLKNFRLEIWNIYGETTSSQASSITFYTSKQGTLDYRNGDDQQLVSANTVVTSFGADKLNTDDLVPDVQNLFRGDGAFGQTDNLPWFWYDSTWFASINETSNYIPELSMTKLVDASLNRVPAPTLANRVQLTNGNLGQIGMFANQLSSFAIYLVLRLTADVTADTEICRFYLSGSTVTNTCVLYQTSTGLKLKLLQSANNLLQDSDGNILLDSNGNTLTIS